MRNMTPKGLKGTDVSSFGIYIDSESRVNESLSFPMSHTCHVDKTHKTPHSSMTNSI